MKEVREEGLEVAVEEVQLEGGEEGGVGSAMSWAGQEDPTVLPSNSILRWDHPGGVATTELPEVERAVDPCCSTALPSRGPTSR